MLGAFDGRPVDVQLVDPDAGLPLAECAGILSLGKVSDPGGHDGDRPPLRLYVGESTVWLWPATFVDGGPIGALGALGITTIDFTLVVGPAGELGRLAARRVPAPNRKQIRCRVAERRSISPRASASWMS